MMKLCPTRKKHQKACIGKRITQTRSHVSLLMTTLADLRPISPLKEWSKKTKSNHSHQIQPSIVLLEFQIQSFEFLKTQK